MRLVFRVKLFSHFSQMNFWFFFICFFFVFNFDFFLWIFSCWAKFSLCKNDLLQIGHVILLLCTSRVCLRWTWRFKWASLENWISQHFKFSPCNPFFVNDTVFCAGELFSVVVRFEARFNFVVICCGGDGCGAVIKKRKAEVHFNYQ